MMMRCKTWGQARAAARCLALAALAVGVAACGSSAAPSSASSSTSSSRYQARLSLAKCLRSHGLNVPDPSPNGGPAAGGAGGGAGGGFRALRSQPNFNSAMQACAKYRAAASPFANQSPQQRAQFQQGLVKFAQCMRAHNINLPDPSASAGGGPGVFSQIPQSERSSPAFQTAMQACSSNLPFRRGGAPGGPGATGPGGSGAGA
jgi:hypothetical protein